MGGGVQFMLKQIWINGSHKYIFRLCCKNIVTLYNPCPNESVALKIDKCIQAFNSVFCVQSVLFNGQSINVQSESVDMTVSDLNGYFLVHIPTNKTEHDNKICINDISILVEPDCLDTTLLGKCTSLFIKPVYAIPPNFTGLGECYLELFNIVSGENPIVYTLEDTINSFDYNQDSIGGGVVSSLIGLLTANCGFTEENANKLTIEGLETYIGPSPWLWSNIVNHVNSNMDDPQNTKDAFECLKDII